MLSRLEADAHTRYIGESLSIAASAPLCLLPYKDKVFVCTFLDVSMWLAIEGLRDFKGEGYH